MTARPWTRAVDRQPKVLPHRAESNPGGLSDLVKLADQGGVDSSRVEGLPGSVGNHEMLQSVSTQWLQHQMEKADRVVATRPQRGRNGSTRTQQRQVVPLGERGQGSTTGKTVVGEGTPAIVLVERSQQRGFACLLLSDER
jgi:hypothetical protein